MLLLFISFLFALSYNASQSALSNLFVLSRAYELPFFFFNNRFSPGNTYTTIYFAITILLNCFNNFFQTVKFFRWMDTKFLIIPIKKSRSVSSHPPSYCPISLVSSLCKPLRKCLKTDWFGGLKTVNYPPTRDI